MIRPNVVKKGEDVYASTAPRRVLSSLEIGLSEFNRLGLE